ncbi:competence protein ComEC [Flavobacterium aciduliphilum]|uniref:Competence protein ComEC n=1 Tax=Flavobacterium aciduliphilum TaxID=1101402 RepID=A0A328YLX1_9FLAO|nr:competence protein ComEC [Flavobacterium aciduliphilum]
MLGLLFAHSASFSLAPVLLALLLSLGSLSYLYFRTQNTLFQKPYFGINVFVVSFLIGCFTLLIHQQTRYPNHYIHLLSSKKQAHTCELVINEKLKNSNNTIRYDASIIRIDTRNCIGKTVLNIDKDSFKFPIKTGSHLLAKGYLFLTKKPNNPSQFDYGNYLKNKQIYSQFYCQSKNCILTKKIDRDIFYFADGIRTRIIQNLKKYKFNAPELHVLVALILGQQQDISPDLIKDYQYAGAVHILSVSGLHVGFILLFITFLLKLFPNTKNAALVKCIITILCLWGFGVLAGLAPSVLRSVAMFSFVALGNFLKRSINIYNTLAISIFIILLFQPAFLFDVGFQLSYIALFFIVWLHPLISSLWTPKNKISKYFWDIVSVSFAAQIGTFPISIYYFHQFPSLFFVTNLIVLPGMSFILGLGVIVMLIALCDSHYSFLYNTLEESIYILNKIISWVASLDSFVFKNIFCSIGMMLGTYLLIFSLIIWLKKPNYQKAIAFLISLIVFQIIWIDSKVTSQKTNEFIVFSGKKKNIISERHGTNVVLHSNDVTPKNWKEEAALQNYITENGCRISKTSTLKNFYSFQTYKIMIIDKSGVYLKNIHPDILILIDAPKVNIERLFRFWKPKMVVFGTTNFKSYVTQWKATCSKENIPFHDISEMGYFKI